MSEQKKIIVESDEINAAIWLFGHIHEVRNWCLKEWDKFEHSLIYESRFSADNVFLDALKEKKEEATRIVPKGTIFYRARVFNQSPAEKILYYMRVVMQRRGENISDFLNGIGPIQVDNWLALLPKKDERDPFVEQAKQAVQLLNRSRFKGYGAKDSTAPPVDHCISYRANPDHIRYLYLSEDAETPIYEIRSSLRQCVSVAKFRCNKSLKLYDLTVESKALSTATSSTLKTYCAIMYICGMFSQPNYNESLKYLPTQYIAEMIKKMGFDGIRYISSLHEGGFNVVLFNPGDCIAISSDLVEINKIHIDIDKPAIYKIAPK